MEIRTRQNKSGQGRLRDPTLISVLAYAGLRPGEALALQWRHVRKRTILVEGAVADGELKATKTGRVRSVQLVPTLIADLEAWRSHMRPIHDREPVFRGGTETYWKSDDWKNWHNRVCAPAMKLAGLEQTRPYALRHSFCSLLISEGRSVVEAAQQMGHAPEMTLSTYAHVFAEASDPLDRRSAAEQIAVARDRQRGTASTASHQGPKVDSSTTKGITGIGWRGY